MTSSVPAVPTTKPPVLAQDWALSLGLGLLIGSVISQLSLAGATAPAGYMHRMQLEELAGVTLKELDWHEARLPVIDLFGSKPRRDVGAVRLAILPGTYFNSAIEGGAAVMVHRLMNGEERTPFVFVQLANHSNQAIGGLIIEFGEPNPDAIEVCSHDGGPPGNRQA